MIARSRFTELHEQIWKDHFGCDQWAEVSKLFLQELEFELRKIANKADQTVAIVDIYKFCDLEFSLYCGMLEGFLLHDQSWAFECCTEIASGPLAHSHCN